MAPDVPRLRLLRGDEAQLFRDYEVALKCAVRHNVNAPEQVVEDACSNAWLQLLRYQPGRTNIFAWLRTVAIREAWRAAERERREVKLDRLPALRDPHATPLEQQLAARDALALLASLPERQRRYLTLLVAGHSHDEIVRHCRTTQTNVTKHLGRARRHLRLVDDRS
jgi:RNA polymerase sigma factor (sigma-70 family)